MDGVVIVTTPEVTEQVAQQAIEAGVKRVWMHNSIGSSVSQAPVDFGHLCLKWYCRATGRLPA